MDTERLHRAVSGDGTEIVGCVHGQGPPLVLVHAGLGDGHLDWAAAVPLLSERFTCYLVSTRGRGRSGEHPDLSLDRHVEDVVAFVESLGEPVGVVGPSGGAFFALGSAARTGAICAVAVYEPLVFEVLDDEGTARFQDAVARMADLASEGRLVDAARDWMRDYADEEEMAALTASGWLEAAARYVPVLLRTIDQVLRSEVPDPTDASVLGQITAPVLVMHGSRSTRPWFADSARHVAEHVLDSRVREIAGAGHSGVWVRPQPVVEELVRFFAVTPARL